MTPPPAYVYLYRCRLCRDTFEVRSWDIRSPLHVLQHEEEKSFASHEPPNPRECAGVGELVGGFYPRSTSQ